MATVDLTNEISPKHPFRPVKPYLADLRSLIKAAPGGSSYTDDYLGKCNRNDLVNIARSLGVTLPIRSA